MKKIIPYVALIIILNWFAYITCGGILERRNSDKAETEKIKSVEHEKDKINRYNEENDTDFDAEKFKNVSIKYYDENGNVMFAHNFSRNLDEAKHIVSFYKDINGNLKLDVGGLDKTNLTYAFTAFIDSDGDLTFESSEDEKYYLRFAPEADTGGENHE
jgi:hypothetical protein